MARLRAPGGVWFVGGDHEDLAEARLITAGSRIRVLDEEMVTVPVGDRRLTSGGIGLHYHSADAWAVVSRLERAPGRDDVRLLLAHRPDAALPGAARAPQRRARDLPAHPSLTRAPAHQAATAVSGSVALVQMLARETAGPGLLAFHGQHGRATLTA